MYINLPFTVLIHLVMKDNALVTQTCKLFAEGDFMIDCHFIPVVGA